MQVVSSFILCTVVVLVCLVCYNKTKATWWFVNNRNLFLEFFRLEVQDQETENSVSGKAYFLIQRQLSSLYVPMWQKW